MKDEVWKIGKGVLMCFLSRSLDAACLGRARLSMTNRFPQSLQEPFLKATAQRDSVTLGCMTRKWSTKPLNNFWDVVYHRRREKLRFSCTLFNYSNKKRADENRTLNWVSWSWKESKETFSFLALPVLLLPNLKGTANSNPSESFHRGSFLDFINCGL